MRVGGRGARAGPHNEAAFADRPLQLWMCGGIETVPDLEEESGAQLPDARVGAGGAARRALDARPIGATDSSQRG